MSTIGSPIETSLVQAAQAQQTASKARDREKAAAEPAKRVRDLVDLRIAGVEHPDAVRKLPQNESEEAEEEHREHPPANPESQPKRIDLRA